MTESQWRRVTAAGGARAIIRASPKGGKHLQAPAYELLSMGLRYWFVLLAVFLLWRAYRLMRKDRRDYRRTLRQLPDAGLVGEVVDLRENRGIPLPREGMMGSGRSCDVRVPGLKRREMEFTFRPGRGVRLIPVHRRHGASLDGEALRAGDAFALHGTVLEIRDQSFRFRLFAGLDLPERVPPPPPPLPQAEFPGEAWGSDLLPDIPPPLPPAETGADPMERTWQYAPLPELAQEWPEEAEPAHPFRRRRRAREEERDDG